jgi:hypothetical protein
VAGADTTAEAVNGVFEDTAGGIVVWSSRSIAAAKETELSNAFLDLLHQAGEKHPRWQETRDAVLRKNEKPRGGQRHGGCLRSPSRIGGSLEEASDSEDVRRLLSRIAGSPEWARSVAGF